MKYGYLGKSNVMVSKITLGTMHFGRRTEEKDAFAIMDKALDMGINFFDTANVYGCAHWKNRNYNRKNGWQWTKHAGIK